MAADLSPSREIRRRLLENQLLLLQPAHLTSQLHDLGVLLARCPIPLAALDLVLAHPATKSLRTQPEPTRDRRDRLIALPIHAHRFLAELRRPLRRTTHPADSSLPATSAEYQDVNEIGSTPTPPTCSRRREPPNRPENASIRSNAERLQTTRPSAGCVEPRMSRFGGSATETSTRYGSRRSRWLRRRAERTAQYDQRDQRGLSRPLLRRAPRPTAANTTEGSAVAARVLASRSPATLVPGATGPIDSSRLSETGWPRAHCSGD